MTQLPHPQENLGVAHSSLFGLEWGCCGPKPCAYVMGSASRGAFLWRGCALGVSVVGGPGLAFETWGHTEEPPIEKLDFRGRPGMPYIDYNIIVNIIKT